MIHFLRKVKPIGCDLSEIRVLNNLKVFYLQRSFYLKILRRVNTFILFIDAKNKKIQPPKEKVRL